MLLCEFHLRKDRLLEELNAAASPQASISIIHRYLTLLADPQGDALKGYANPKQAEAALSILVIYNDHFRKLLDLFQHQPNPVANSSAVGQAAAPETSGLPGSETLYGVGAAALIGGLLVNPFLGIPLALAGGLIVSKWVSNNNDDDNAPAIETQPMPGNPIDFSYLLFELESLFKAVDSIVEDLGHAEEKDGKEVIEAKLANQTRLLTFTQEILGWHRNHKSALPKASSQILDKLLDERLGEIFAEQNIQIIYYGAEQHGLNEALFEFVDQVGDVALSERPALSSNGAVLLRGRVVKPRPFDPDTKPKSRTRKSK
jgi:hypothetical protein